MHGGLHFRVGHQRQVDQVLNRAPIEIPPDRLVFGLDLLPGRVRRDVDAEQAQARERAGHGLRVFPTSRYGAGPSGGRLSPGRLSTPRAATVPQSVARLSRSYRLETRTPRARAAA